MWLRVMGGLVIALAGALLAVWAHLPLPWMLGALLVTAATRIAGLGTVCPRPARNGGQWVIGTSLGLYFTPQVIGHIGSNAGPIVVGMLFALALAFMGTAMLRRYTDADLKTAWFSSAIGGASEMANLAERHGARIDRVATAHSVRVLLVVVTVPFIFQWWGVAGLDPTVPGPTAVHGAGLAALVALTCVGGMAFVKLRLPNPWVLGPMLIAMLLTSSGIEWSALPDYVPKVGQLLIGWSLGDRYRPDFFRAAPRFIAVVAAFTLTALGLAFGLGALLACWSVAPVPTLILGTTPGGIAEMAITAKVLQLGVPVVTAFHVTRMVFVVIVTGPIYAILARRQG
ncbi:AbrB family transcriptional regulator [Achromobacter spanius]|uniref:Ammonia monooxygenase n=1 Tax=Achromobacter spanius TaxID=217203 RepID=A0AAW3I589_9BURK|nr:AbrB family transcriptional regulator [Achromobacter spanius]AZS82859.1 AbrB family transcriptional regulator [Achromobacter spanius]KNE27105.1 ammonia monooxygenase [Achromobacter spanius]MCW3151203.1 AbrB family transcriptional regulator [Achromobacter spanius]